jgi:hypothetical protein
LEGGPPGFRQGSSVPPPYSGTCATPLHTLRLQGSHLLWRAVPGRFDSSCEDGAGKPRTGPTTPTPRKESVWASPRSLAATCGISFDFSSCRYLDVSVPCVGSPVGVTGLSTCWVAPFGNPWFTGCVLLPMAYRSLPRPSSPTRAQASPVRPYCA